MSDIGLLGETAAGGAGGGQGGPPLPPVRRLGAASSGRSLGWADDAARR